MTRLPRTLRLDSSDLSVFESAALPGEWAVPGGFMFIDQPVLSPAQHQAFACGFLGTRSFGWSTLVRVEAASPADIESVIADLASYFQRALGAPSSMEARAVALEEVRFAAGLCEHPIGTMLTVARRYENEEVVERYATLTVAQ
jgi:hypothetical protein